MGLLTPEKTEMYDELAVESGSPRDNGFPELAPSEAASPEEEGFMGAGLDMLMSFMYSEKGMASVAQALQQDDRPLYEKLPEVAMPMLLKVRGDLEEAFDAPVPSSIFFAEGGLMQSAVQMLLEVASSMGLPGADDPDQASGAVINLYKKAGEYMLESNDPESLDEVMRLGSEMAMTAADGTRTDPDDFMREAQKKTLV